jgi:hypothetical protein
MGSAGAFSTVCELYVRFGAEQGKMSLDVDEVKVTGTGEVTDNDTLSLSQTCFLGHPDCVDCGQRLERTWTTSYVRGQAGLGQPAGERLSSHEETAFGNIIHPTRSPYSLVLSMRTHILASSGSLLDLWSYRLQCVAEGGKFMGVRRVCRWTVEFKLASWRVSGGRHIQLLYGGVSGSLSCIRLHSL